MGSLMAGWDSPIHDSESVKCRRNKSCTKEDIESYWRSKKQVEEEHLGLGATSSSPSASCGNQKELTVGDYEAKFQTALPPPSKNKNEDFMDMKTSVEEIKKKNGWWRKSSWAFLNEPPELERASDTYVSQFYIANMTPSKSNAGVALHL